MMKEVLDKQEVEKKKALIIEMVKSTDNQDALQYLQTFIRLFLEKWG
ncbi:MAG: hypothetical protein HFI75_00665 [Lachnospiraceae bacterium]|nr:hypothetical protein [Lachnospiraceae bacterium]